MLDLSPFPIQRKLKRKSIKTTKNDITLIAIPERTTPPSITTCLQNYSLISSIGVHKQ